ncbi:hypothetical protein TRFO_43291 [Tritrichomonas foetus]|uniref:SCP domain-containing protein n=1 Tax=Tritrichomonas foetus TaxID=1144522 RepID=A0A1J4KV91_9EUKA|nr:hypothetical protein TRFO_43291 [Tritrichomonas foetus]|eukprot:OHT13660.1 hypothetical protein TRFO_43291 [Tritrichomonas foetus]
MFFLFALMAESFLLADKEPKTIRFDRLQQRTLGEVCTAHFNEYNRTIPSPIKEGSEPPGKGKCTTEWYNDKDTESGTQRANYFRTMVGYQKPNLVDRDKIKSTVECTVICNNLGHVDHYPPSQTKCYTQAGGQACGESNLAGGWSTQSVDAYMRDDGNPTMGHRHWVLNKGTMSFAFGSTGTFTAMRVIGTKGNGPVEELPFVSYPPPGFAPLKNLNVKNGWSFIAPEKTNKDNVKIQIWCEGKEIGTKSVLTGISTANSIVYKPNQDQIVLDSLYEVKITNLDSGNVYEFTTMFHTCQNNEISSDLVLKSPGSSNAGMIAGIVIAVIVVLAVAGVCVFFFVIKPRLNKAASNGENDNK